MRARAMTHLAPPIALSVGIVKTSRCDAHGGSTERASHCQTRTFVPLFRDRTKAALTVSRIWHFHSKVPTPPRVFSRGFRGIGHNEPRGACWVGGTCVGVRPNPRA